MQYKRNIFLWFVNDSCNSDLEKEVKTRKLVWLNLIITQISIKYQNINSQTNKIPTRYFDKPQYCTLVQIWDFNKVIIIIKHCYKEEWRE